MARPASKRSLRGEEGWRPRNAQAPPEKKRRAQERVGPLTRAESQERDWGTKWEQELKKVKLQAPAVVELEVEPMKRFTPPNLFGIRHLPTDVRHWGACPDVPLCSKRGRWPVSEFTLDESGDGLICGVCVAQACNKFGILDAQDYAEGKEVATSAKS